MATAEERLKILNMIAEGKISAEDGSRLLDALKSGRKPRGEGSASGRARYLRVRITGHDNKVKADINLPMSLVDVGLRMGARFSGDLEGLDVEDFEEAIASGKVGKIMEMHDENGEQVEIFLE